MFSLRLQGGIPLSEQLEARIAELIIGGEMAENEKLPAVREVAKALTINPNTVQKSYKLMEEEGILRTISNVKSVVYVDEQIMERLQQEMIQETVDDFIANCRECGLPFQKVVAILSTRWDI